MAIKPSSARPDFLTQHRENFEEITTLQKPELWPLGGNIFFSEVIQTPS